MRRPSTTRASGSLFLHGGLWNGRRIVSRRWVREATAARIDTGYPNPYGYMWWVDGARPRRFYAFGNYGQYVYVAPDAGVVIVRLGSDWGRGNEAWLAMFRDLADELSARGPTGTSRSPRVSRTR